MTSWVFARPLPPSLRHRALRRLPPRAARPLRASGPEFQRRSPARRPRSRRQLAHHPLRVVVAAFRPRDVVAAPHRLRGGDGGVAPHHRREGDDEALRHRHEGGGGEARHHRHGGGGGEARHHRHGGGRRRGSSPSARGGRRRGSSSLSARSSGGLRRRLAGRRLAGGRGLSSRRRALGARLARSSSARSSAVQVPPGTLVSQWGQRHCPPSIMRQQFEHSILRPCSARDVSGSVTMGRNAPIITASNDVRRAFISDHSASSSTTGSKVKLANISRASGR